MTETIAWILVLILLLLLGAVFLLPRLRRRRSSTSEQIAGRAPDAEAILAAAPVSFMVADAQDPELPVVFVTDRFVELTGYPVSQVLGRNARFLQREDRDQAVRHDIREAIAQGRSHHSRLRNYREDGSRYWTSLHLAPLRDAAGRVTHYVGVQMDVTEQVETEQRLRDRQHQQYALAAIAQRSVEMLDLDILFEETLTMLQRVLNLNLAGIIEHGPADDTFLLRAGIGWQPGIVGRSTARPSRESPEVLAFASRQTILVHDIEQDERFGPQPVYARHGVRSSLTSVIWVDGEPWGLLGAAAAEPNRFGQSQIEFIQASAALLGHAIAHQRQAQRMEADRSLLDAIVSSSADAIVTLDPAGAITSANPAVFDMLGHAPNALTGKSIDVLLPSEPGSSTGFDFRDPRLVGSSRELDARHRDGHPVPVELTLARTQVEEQHLYVVTLRDLTQRHALQQQLFHAQKMEAIGQLTGGVAHDFNNLLTVILGNLSTLLEQSTDEEARQLIEETVNAADRGSTLTHRLLAFSRQQPLAPRPLDANQLVSGLERLLTRTFGESHSVRFEAAPDLWPCVADPGHLEAALLNLAVNARDAMPGGGRITIQTANSMLDAEDCLEDDELEPGSYVSITVRDTGTGMSPEVIANAFEPYFTTKPFGQGSGLGLSMVFGFVKQSGGHVRLRSELEVGTEVQLFLPKAAMALQTEASGAEAADAHAAREQQALAPNQAPRVHILMVEDDPLVGSSTQRLLQHEGYMVTLAADAGLALSLLESSGPFDLLFTDMVMPGSMNGRELVAAARERQPDLAVLLTSGYSDTDLRADDTPAGQVDFLQKPYSRAALARSIRKTLAGER